MKKFSLHNLLDTSLACIAFLMVGAVAVLNFIYTAVIEYSAYERITISTEPLHGLLTVAVLLCLVAAAVPCRKYPEKVGVKVLFWALAAVYSIAALYLVLNIDGIIRADVRQVYNAARGASEGNFTAFMKGGYAERYPHQLGLVFYDGLLQRFTRNTKILFVANFAFVVGINYVSCRIAEYLFADKRVTVLTTVVSFAFLPQLFFILFGYGLVPGLFFLLCAFYFAIRLSREHSVLQVLTVTAFSAAAVLLKKNCLIGVVAIIIYLLLTVKKRSVILHAVTAVCVLLASFLPGRAVVSYYEDVSGQPLDGGVPSVLWMAMGTDPDNVSRAPGWYDSSVWNIYSRTRYDSEASALIGEEKLADNIDRILASPEASFDYFRDKAVSVWCEPTYQSIWSGPLEDCGQQTYTDLTKSFFTGGDGAKTVTAVSDGVGMFIWVFAALFLLLCRKGCDGWQIPFMYFAGGFLFHTVWEGKSQYVYPYVFVLIPFAACAFVKLADMIGDVISKRGGKPCATPKINMEVEYNEI